MVRFGMMKGLGDEVGYSELYGSSSTVQHFLII